MNTGPWKNQPLPPCVIREHICKKHGVLYGSMNAILSTNANTEENEYDDDIYASYIVHGQDIFDMQLRMKLSRKRSRQATDEEREAESASLLYRNIQQPKSKMILQREQDRGARAQEVALSSRKSSNHIKDGKYQPLTLMGLPAEIHLSIMKFLFREMQCIKFESSQDNAMVAWETKKKWENGGIISRRECILHPLAILQTAKLLYTEGIKIFQSNALLVSDYRPIEGTENVDELVDVYMPHGKEVKTWPGLKRWKVYIHTPDSGSLWGIQDFPFQNADELEVLLQHRIKQYLEPAFKDGGTLDLLIVHFHQMVSLEGQPGISVYCPDWAVQISRFLVMESLLSLKGKVKKLEFQGDWPSKLNNYARFVELSIQGLPTGATHLSINGTPALAVNSTQYWEQHYASVPHELLNGISSGDWTLHQCEHPGLSVKWTDEDVPYDIESILNYTMPLSWYEDTDTSPMKKMNEVVELGREILGKLGVKSSDLIDDWLEIYPYVECKEYPEPDVLAQDNGPSFLYWPNSDLELAARRKLPYEGSFCLPLVHCDPINAYEWTEVWINFNTGFVWIGFDRTWLLKAPECRKIEGVWWNIPIPCFLCPRTHGIYRLTSINGVRTPACLELKVVRPKPRTLEMQEDDYDKEIRRLNNINPWYDGPEDDGLNWLDSDEAFDVEMEDKLIGEVDFDDLKFWSS